MERGYVGVRLQELTSGIAQALGRPDTKGALVASVEPGGPADKAGIKIGDVITQSRIRLSKDRAICLGLCPMKPGTRAPLTVFRNGKTQEITVAIDQRQEDRPVRTGALENSDKIGKRLGSSSNQCRNLRDGA